MSAQRTGKRQPRARPAMADPATRVRSFIEVNRGLGAEQARSEAARCILCKNAPCVAACPVGNDIPRFLSALAAGRMEEAVFAGSVPLTAVCGRVCYRPCEKVCVLGIKGEAVAINACERFAADARPLPLEIELHPERRGPRGARVAIIGSGPAGLVCAYELRRAGVGVTVFEAAPAFGGMLALGIPEYRLPRDVLQAEIASLARLGVAFRARAPVASIQAIGGGSYDAVFLAVGAHRGRKLGIPGEGELAGCLDAVDFLRRVNLGEPVPPGKRVVVVGGGDSAIDAARTAVRLGSERVTILYRRSRAEMPANPGEVEEAEAEGVEVILLAAPARLLGRDGRVSAIECIRMRLGEPDSSGRPRPVPIEGSEFVIEADCVVPAISQDPVLDLIPEGAPIGRTRWGTVVVGERLDTGMPGVFAGGDAVNGPSTVGAAMADGRRAAAAILEFLERRGAGLAGREETVASLGRA